MGSREERNEEARLTAIERGIPLETLELTAQGWLEYPIRRIIDGIERVILEPSSGSEFYLYHAENGKWYTGRELRACDRGEGGYPNPLWSDGYETKEDAMQAEYEYWERFLGKERNPAEGYLF